MFYVALLLTPLQLDNVRFVIGYLVLLNVGLAGFNLLSAFPMGGGRLLRALLAQSHSYPVATQAATEVGKVVAVILGGVGVLLPNIWVIVIVIFVYIGAVNTTRQTVLAWAFQTVEVPDLMAAANMEAIPPVLSADLLKRMVQNRHTTYPVLESGRLNGMVRLEHITSIQ